VVFEENSRLEQDNRDLRTELVPILWFPFFRHFFAFFADFRHILSINISFFLKTNVMIQFLHKLVVVMIRMTRRVWKKSPKGYIAQLSFCQNEHKLFSWKKVAQNLVYLLL
jgi:hypothetical protein